MKQLFCSLKENPVIKYAIILLFFFLIGPRFIFVAEDLPYYSIDENDVVEFALGYFDGNLNPYWFKYGAFYSYLLAFFYYVNSFFVSTSIDEFIESYFFNPTTFYLTGRIFNSIIHVFLGIISFNITHKFISKKAAPYVLFIALIPFADTLTNYKIRVDSLLAFTNILVLYYLFSLIKVKKPKYYILLGIFIGVGLGVKTLPGFLIMPTVLLGVLISDIARNELNNQKFNLFKLVLYQFIDFKNYLLLLSILLGFFVSHPFAFLEFDDFFNEQKNTFIADSSSDFTSGSELALLSNPLGLQFILALIFVLIYGFIDSIKRKKWVIFPLIFFVLSFWLAFARGASREYFYIPILPVASILLGYYLHTFLKKFLLDEKMKSSIGIVVIILIAVTPLKVASGKYDNFDYKTFQNKKSTKELAEEWILSKVVPGSKILYYGYYTSLPRLIDPNPQEQAKYGDYFMYQRWNNKYLVDRFSNFMVNYSKNGLPTYDLIYQVNVSKNSGNQSYYTRYEMGEDEQFLLSSARQAGAEYIVTSYNLEQYPEFQKLRVWSSMGKSNFGGDINIYKIQ